ncbi:MAG: LamG-like jellyroll fold domain-containing protein, partial [Pseudomonadota bacterium]
EADIEHTAAPAYGIVTTIDEVAEAVMPAAPAVDTGPIAPPDDLGHAADLTLPGGLSPVLGFVGSQRFSGESDDFLNAGHTPDLALENGTITLGFNADAITGYDVLFSKDASGNGDGGHLTAFVTEGGDLKVRSQSKTGEMWFVGRDVVEVGKEHEFVFTFGADGAQLILDGNVLDEEDGWSVGLANNEELFLIGANGQRSGPGELGNPRDYFEGTITDFALYDTQDGFLI